MSVRFVVAIAMLVGCYSPSYKDCQFQCSSSNTCPSGLECLQGMCRLEGTSGSCGAMQDANDDSMMNDDARDSMIDSGTATWTMPVEVPLSGGPWTSPTLTADEMEMYVVSTGGRIFKTTRTGSAWAIPQEVTELSPGAAMQNETPMLSPNGLSLYFGSNRGTSGVDIYRATRTALGGAWSAPGQVDDALGSNMNESSATVNMNERRMLFSSDRGASVAIYESTFSTANMAWSVPTRMLNLDSLQSDAHPSMTADGLTVVFMSDRAGLDYDLYISARLQATQSFPDPVKLSDLSGIGPDVEPWISPDGNVIYFARGLAANRKIYRSTRIQ